MTFLLASLLWVVVQAPIVPLQNTDDFSISEPVPLTYGDGVSTSRNLSVTFQFFGCGKPGGQNLSFMLTDPATQIEVNYTLRCPNRLYILDRVTTDLVPEMIALFRKEYGTGQSASNHTLLPEELTTEALLAPGEGPLDPDGNPITNVTAYLEALAQAAPRGSIAALRTDLPEPLHSATLVNLSVASDALGLDVSAPPVILTLGVYINGTNGTFSNSTPAQQLLRVSRHHRAKHLMERDARRNRLRQEVAASQDRVWSSTQDAYRVHYQAFRASLAESAVHSLHLFGHTIYQESEHFHRRTHEVRTRQLAHQAVSHLNRYGHVRHLGDADLQNHPEVQRHVQRHAARTFRTPPRARNAHASSHPQHLQISDKDRLLEAINGKQYLPDSVDCPRCRTVQQNRDSCRAAIHQAWVTAGGSFPGLATPLQIDAWITAQFNLYPNWQLHDDPSRPLYVANATCYFLPWDSFNLTQRSQLPDTIGLECRPLGLSANDVLVSSKFSDSDFFDPGNSDTVGYQAQLHQAQSIVWWKDRNGNAQGTQMAVGSFFVCDPAGPPCPCYNDNDMQLRVCPLNGFAYPRNLSSVASPQYGSVLTGVSGIQTFCKRVRGAWLVAKATSIPSLNRDNIPKTETTCCVGDPNCDTQLQTAGMTNPPAWFAQIHDNNVPFGTDVVGSPPTTGWFAEHISCPTQTFFTGHSSCDCQKVVIASYNFGVVTRENSYLAAANTQASLAVNGLLGGIRDGAAAWAGQIAGTYSFLHLATDQVTATTQAYLAVTQEQLVSLQQVRDITASAQSLDQLSKRSLNHIKDIFSSLLTNITLAITTLTENAGLFGNSTAAIQSVLDTQLKIQGRVGQYLTTISGIRALTAQFEAYLIGQLNAIRFSSSDYRKLVSRVMPAIRDTRTKFGFKPFLPNGPDPDGWYGLKPSPPLQLEQRTRLVDVVRVWEVATSGHLHQRNFALFCSPGAMLVLMDADLTQARFRNLIGPSDCVLGSLADGKQCKGCRIQASHLRCALPDPSPSGQDAMAALLSSSINNGTQAAFPLGSRRLNDPELVAQSFCEPGTVESLVLSPTLPPGVGAARALASAAVPPPVVGYSGGSAPLNTSHAGRFLMFHNKTAVDTGNVFAWDQLTQETCLGFGNTDASYDALIEQQDALYELLVTDATNTTDPAGQVLPVSLLDLVRAAPNATGAGASRVITPQGNGMMIMSQGMQGMYLNTRLELLDVVNSCETSDISATTYYGRTGKFPVTYVIQHFFHQSFVTAIGSVVMQALAQNATGALPSAGLLIQKKPLGSPVYPITDVNGESHESLPQPSYPKGSTLNLTQPGSLDELVELYLEVTQPLTGLPKYTRDQATIMAQQLIDHVNQVHPIALKANETDHDHVIVQPTDVTDVTWVATGDFMIPLHRWVLREVQQTITLEADLSRLGGSAQQPAVSYTTQRFGLQDGTPLIRSAPPTGGGGGGGADGEDDGPSPEALAAVKGFSDQSPASFYIQENGGTLFVGGYLSCWLTSAYARNLTTGESAARPPPGCPMPVSNINDPILNQTSPQLYLYDIPVEKLGQAGSLQSRCHLLNYLSLQRGPLRANASGNLVPQIAYPTEILQYLGLLPTQVNGNVTLPSRTKWPMFTLEQFYHEFNFSLGGEVPLSVSTGYDPRCAESMQPYLRGVVYSRTSDGHETLTCTGDPSSWYSWCWFLYHFQPIWRPASGTVRDLEFPDSVAFESVTNQDLVTVTIEFPANLLLRVTSTRDPQSCTANDLNPVYRDPFTSSAQLEFSVPMLTTDTFWLVRFTMSSSSLSTLINSCPTADRTFAIESFATNPNQDFRRVLPTPNCFPSQIDLYRIAASSLPAGPVRTNFVTNGTLHYTLQSADSLCWTWVNPNPNLDPGWLSRAQPSGTPTFFEQSTTSDSHALALWETWSQAVNAMMGELTQTLFTVVQEHFGSNVTYRADIDLERYPINTSTPLNPTAVPGGPLDPSVANTSSAFPVVPPTSSSGNFSQDLVDNFTSTAALALQVLTGRPSVNGNITTTDLSLTGQNIQDVNDMIARLQNQVTDLQSLITKNLADVQHALEVQSAILQTFLGNDTDFNNLQALANLSVNLPQLNISGVVSAYTQELLANITEGDALCLKDFLVNIAVLPNGSAYEDIWKNKYERRILTNLYNLYEKTVVASNPGSYLNGGCLGTTCKPVRAMLWVLIWTSMLTAVAFGAAWASLASVPKLGPAGYALAKTFGLQRINPDIAKKMAKFEQQQPRRSSLSSTAPSEMRPLVPSATAATATPVATTTTATAVPPLATAPVATGRTAGPWAEATGRMDNESESSSEEEERERLLLPTQRREQEQWRSVVTSAGPAPERKARGPSPRAPRAPRASSQPPPHSKQKNKKKPKGTKRTKGSVK